MLVKFEVIKKELAASTINEALKSRAVAVLSSSLLIFMMTNKSGVITKIAPSFAKTILKTAVKISIEIKNPSEVLLNEKIFIAKNSNELFFSNINERAIRAKNVIIASDISSVIVFKSPKFAYPKSSAIIAPIKLIVPNLRLKGFVKIKNIVNKNRAICKFKASFYY